MYFDANDIYRQIYSNEIFSYTNGNSTKANDTQNESRKKTREKNLYKYTYRMHFYHVNKKKTKETLLYSFNDLNRTRVSVNNNFRSVFFSLNSVIKFQHNLIEQNTKKNKELFIILVLVLFIILFFLTRALYFFWVNIQ